MTLPRRAGESVAFFSLLLLLLMCGSLSRAKKSFAERVCRYRFQRVAVQVYYGGRKYRVYDVYMNMRATADFLDFVYSDTAVGCGLRAKTYIYTQRELYAVVSELRVAGFFTVAELRVTESSCTRFYSLRIILQKSDVVQWHLMYEVAENFCKVYNII